MAVKLVEDWKKVIEEDLIAKSNSLKTYADWEHHRKSGENWKELLCKNRPDLTKTISVDDVLYDKLLSLQVFNKRTLETIKQKKGHCAQASAMLDALTRRPFEGFLFFCQSLVETNQKHVVLNYLTPEIPHVAEPLMDVTDAMPADVKALVQSTVAFDWRKLVRENLPKLTQAIDPDHGLLTRLLSMGVINEWTFDTFKEPKGMSVRVGVLLDHILLKRPDADFEKLCVALRDTNQGHVVDGLLTPGADQTDLAASPARYLLMANVPVDESLLQSLLVPNWRDLIKHRRNDIVDKLEVSDDFLNELVKCEVMNIPVWERLKEEGGMMKRAENLLDHMLRRPDLDFARFRWALNKCEQSHVIDGHLTNPGPGEFSQSSPPRANNPVPPASSQPSTWTHLDDSSVKSVHGTVHPTFERQTSLKDMLPVHDTSRVELGDTKSMLVTSKQTQPKSEHTQESRDSNNYSNNYSIATQEGCSSGDGDGQLDSIFGSNKPELMETESLEAEMGPTQIKEICVKPCSRQFYEEHKSTAYEMSKRTRGRCYIFNIEHVRGMSQRKGTTVDGKNITELFTKLHFRVEEFSNFTADQIRQKIIQISNDASLENDQCFVLFVMSHGTVKTVSGKMKDCIFGSDGNFLTPEHILIPLTDRQCRHLRGKPRLIFFQACRGEYYDKTDSVEIGSDPVQPTTVTDFTPDEAPSYIDFLIGYPTQSSYRSFRNTEFGSWYINAFVKVFMRHVHSMGLCAMLNTLNGNVSQWASNTGVNESTNKTQIANYVSNLRKADLFFFPGIFDD